VKIPRLRITAVRKSFGATAALRHVSLDLAPGEVHALIGENGAGKSTLMKILSGAYQPDGGQMELDGQPFSPDNPLDARKAGIAMIYQELTLAPHLSVEENIVLGAEPGRFGFIHRKRRREIARQALEELGHGGIPLKAPVHSRSIAEQQMVEIARALTGSPKVLIMDEPTSSLTQVDAENLFRVVQRLRDRGVTVIYISHFLEECQRVADRYTVLRDGESVATGAMKSAKLPEIIRQMVGREIADIYPRTPHPIGAPILVMKNLAGRSRPQSATLTLREGEILGIAGLIGSGRTEMLRAFFGLDPIRDGELFIDGRPDRAASPARRLAQGFGLLSENRKEEGLMLNRSLADNLTITRMSPFSVLGFIRGRAQRQATEEWMRRLGVRARHPQQLIAELSGGNQQKIAIGRLLHHEARVLLFDEPTRGIDVASKAQVYKLISQLAAQGKAVLFVSSYLPELLGVCDTIAVMCRGILSEARPASEWTEHSIMSAAIGQAPLSPQLT
jgi:ribose transport system ATP-binding protein